MGGFLIGVDYPRPTYRPWSGAWRSRLQKSSFFDQHWLCTDTNSLTTNGIQYVLSFRHHGDAGRLRAKDDSLVVFFGLPALALPGAIFPGGTESGSPCTTVSTTGRSEESGKAYSSQSKSTPILMAP